MGSKYHVGCWLRYGRVETMLLKGDVVMKLNGGWWLLMGETGKRAGTMGVESVGDGSPGGNKVTMVVCADDLNH